jgi:hypothetical protein
MHPIWNVPVPGRAAPSQTVLWDDFINSTISATNDAANWDLLAAGGGAVLSNTEAGGVLAITGDVTAATETVVAQNGAPFEVHPNKPIYFEARFKVATAATQDWDIGLMTEDTANPHDTDPADGVYFGASGDANIDYIIEPGPGAVQSRVDTGKDISDASYITVAYKLTDTKCLIWVDLEDGNGPALVGTVTSGLPAAGTELAVHIANEGGALVMDVDYVLVIQDR